MNDPFWREGFGPLLDDAHGVTYGDIAALETLSPPRSTQPLSLNHCKPRAESMYRRAPTCNGSGTVPAHRDAFRAG